MEVHSGVYCVRDERINGFFHSCRRPVPFTLVLLVGATIGGGNVGGLVRDNCPDPLCEGGRRSSH